MLKWKGIYPVMVKHCLCVPLKKGSHVVYLRKMAIMILQCMHSLFHLGMKANGCVHPSIYYMVLTCKSCLIYIKPAPNLVTNVVKSRQILKFHELPWLSSEWSLCVAFFLYTRFKILFLFEKNLNHKISLPENSKRFLQKCRFDLLILISN